VCCSITFLLSTLLCFLLSFSFIICFLYVFLLSLVSSHFLLFLTDPLPGFFYLLQLHILNALYTSQITVDWRTLLYAVNNPRENQRILLPY
jgi:hypothetical protein